MRGFLTVTTVLCCLLVVFGNLQPQQVKELENKISIAGNDLAQKYCPMKNFKGELFCPSGKQAGLSIASETSPSTSSSDKKVKPVAKNSPPKSATNPTEIIEIYELEANEKEPKFNTLELESLLDVKPTQTQFIISGTGFDRTKRELKFPVLQSGLGLRLAQKRIETSPKIFNGVENFLAYIFRQPTTAGQEQWQSGLYAQSEQEVLKVAQSFSLSQTKIGITQEIYTTHQAGVKSMTALPDFSAIVDSLPPWNPNDPSVKSLYDMLIQFYGTDVATKTEHGGAFYQQTTVKECYGGNVEQGMKDDIKNSIQNKPPQNGAGYARFRKLGVLNILGGNPEVSNIQQRIASFDQAPAPVTLTTVPIWTVIANAQKKNFVKAAVEAYIKSNTPNVAKIINDVKVAKENDFKGPQKIYTMDYQLEQDWVFVTHWPNCPVARPKNSQYTPQCTTIGQPISLAAGKTVSRGPAFQNNQAFIERNAAGQLRIITKVGAAIKHSSAWVTQGCAKVRYGPQVCVTKKGFLWRKKKYCLNTDEKLYRYACINCVPSIKQGGMGKHNLRHTLPECECAGF